jgi:CubicO group peptidase (beta-lactamase class C family)
MPYLETHDQPRALSRRAWLTMAGAAALSGCAAPSRLPSASGFDAVRALAQDAIDKSIAPGVSMKVFRGRTEVFADTRGFSVVEARQALQPESLYRVYSQTKAVTTVAALILAEAGELNLDDPVSAYIPAFARTPVYVSGTTLADLQVEPQARPVSVRDLMRHTAGLIYRHDAHHPVSGLYVARGIDSGSGERFAPADGSPPFTSLAAMVDALAEIPLVAQPGMKFTYGHASDVLGRVVEVVSGKRLRDFAQEKIFAPLAMNASVFEVPATLTERLSGCYLGIAAERARDPLLDIADPAELRPGALRLIDAPGASVFAAPRPIDFGGAGLICSASDYLRFARMLAQGGALDGERILSRASVDAMAQNQLGEQAMANPGLQRLGLGFGLGLATYVNPALAPQGVPASVRFWGGAASTIFWVDPDRDLSGVIMAQVFGGDFRAYHVPLIRALYAAL